MYKATKLHKGQLLEDQLSLRSNILYDAVLRRTRNVTDIISELSEHGTDRQ